MTKNNYLGIPYLIGGLIQPHPLKQHCYVLWCSRGSFWKQHSELLHKFLSPREKYSRKLTLHSEINIQK